MIPTFNEIFKKHLVSPFFSLVEVTLTAAWLQVWAGRFDTFFIFLWLVRPSWWIALMGNTVDLPRPHADSDNVAGLKPDSPAALRKSFGSKPFNL